MTADAVVWDLRHGQSVRGEASRLDFFGLLAGQAGMAELADAADSKSADPCGHGGSTPPPGTNKTKSLSQFGPSKTERPKSFGGFFMAVGATNGVVADKTRTSHVTDCARLFYLALSHQGF